jgi:hypothetical protein
MIRLYSGSGSGEVQVLGEALPAPAWAIFKRTVARLLEARGHTQDAARLLNEIPFQLKHGTNGFGDEFCLLHYVAPLDRYVSIAEDYESDETKRAYRQLAAAITEAGHYVRFIVLDLDTTTDTLPVGVDAPTLTISSDAVQRALADAEQLIQSRGASSGVDRVHTAFHGYLRAVATHQGLPHDDDSSITELFALLRAQHPALAAREPRTTDIDRVLRSIAKIVDALNPVRNRASGAHPNALVLAEAEAMLIINSVNTLLHYLDSRLRETGAA